MKKTLKIALCLVLVLSTVLCLTACSDVSGKYVISSMTMGGQTFSGELLDIGLAQNGVTRDAVYIQLNDDGTGFMAAMEDSGAIKYDDNYIWSADGEGEKLSYTVDDDVLTLHGPDGVKMVFTKK